MYEVFRGLEAARFTRLVTIIVQTLSNLIWDLL